MKNVLISLLALAAVSGAALASDRFHGERDTNASTKQNMQSSAVNSHALAIVKTGKANVTAFERMTLTRKKTKTAAQVSPAFLPMRRATPLARPAPYPRHPARKQNMFTTPPPAPHTTHKPLTIAFRPWQMIAGICRTRTYAKLSRLDDACATTLHQPRKHPLRHT